MRGTLVKGRGGAYTLGMLEVVLMVVFAVPLDALIVGEVPKNVPTFRITFENDDTDYWGAILIDDEWLMDPSGPGPDVTQLEVVFDAPWMPRSHYRVLCSKVKVYRESFVRRQKRLEDGWDQAGFTFVTTPRGWQPVLKTDLEFAQRARAMAAELERSAAAPEPETPAPPLADPGPHPLPGFMRQWGAHMAVVLVGTALFALVVKTLLLRREL